MSIIQNIQKKSQKQKITIMWTIAGVVAVLLIIVWVLSSRFHKNVAKDTSLFDTISQGLKEVKNNYKK